MKIRLIKVYGTNRREGHEFVYLYLYAWVQLDPVVGIVISANVLNFV